MSDKKDKKVFEIKNIPGFKGVKEIVIDDDFNIIKLFDIVNSLCYPNK